MDAFGSTSAHLENFNVLDLFSELWVFLAVLWTTLDKYYFRYVLGGAVKLHVN